MGGAKKRKDKTQERMVYVIHRENMGAKKIELLPLTR
jgi:hypothetical protein